MHQEKDCKYTGMNQVSLQPVLPEVYKKIEELKKEIEKLDYRITGVTGISLTASRGSGSQEDKELHRLKLMSKKDALERNIVAQSPSS